ncbi:MULTISPECIES: ATP-dependent DNA helicase [unclassified Bradyrhizobium]|uniref:ATP-dependent helicase n=1 Tax=unclassified Bradyrhizobium TaxID=2631580 RepID=UPI0028E450B7|nr:MULTISPECIES: ATP-dependent DNA helicase [unclassified Bradyrhizobium]
MKLTTKQTDAINHADGNLQLIACAGSGKTEVVAQHITKMLTPLAGGGMGLTPANIIAFTFTEKAAAELKQRVLDRCRERLPGLVGMAEMYIGTIHGFSLDLLRAEVPEYLKYDVLNEVQQVLLVNRNSAKSGLTATTTLQGAKLKRYIDTRLYIEAMSVLRESAVDWQALKGTSILDGYNAYTTLLNARGEFDYSAILQCAVQALEQNVRVRTRLAERVRVVLVDEYQDVNPVQERLVRALNELGASIKVVGDDDQTIYQWRGSDVGNILSFAKRYAPVETIKLEANFRSSSGITDVARIVIEKNTSRLEKVMESTQAQVYEAGDIVALQFSSPEDEAEYIARTCKTLRGTMIEEDGLKRPISWSDMAILVRYAKFGEPLRRAFDRNGIPFVSVGMDTLFDTPEGEAARKLFYFMANRLSRDDALQAWRTANLGIAEVVLESALKNAEDARAKMAVEDQDVRFSIYNIQRQFIGFLEQIGLREEVIPNRRGPTVFYNLGKFSQAISDFESIYFHSRPLQKYESFADFLQYQAEDAYGQSTGIEDKFVGLDAVQILTIHRAKGLQWPVVFVPQLVKNHFPASPRGGRNVWHVIPPSAVAGHSRFRGSEEDERRLFYVAITRSQKHLHLTTAPTPGSKRYVHPSAFFHDVLESKFVKRLKTNYDGRERGQPRSKPSISNVNLSFSDIRYFLECPYQFKMRTLYGFNAPLDEALGYGKTLHDALAELHQRAISGLPVEPSDADELVERHLHVPFAYPTLRDTMRASAKRTVAKYIQARKSEFDKIEFSEKAIEVALEDGITVSGRIDLVRRRDTNSMAIVDLKSTERAQAEELTEAQLHIYALGYRELTGNDADFVEIYELDTQTRKPRAVDADLIADVIHKVKSTAGALRANSFTATPNTIQCGRCDFSKLCSSSISVKAVQGPPK